MNAKTLLGLFFLVMICLSSCQDDAEIILFRGSEPITDTGACTNQISSSTIYLNSTRQSEDIGIANGKGKYSATSADESIVTAAITGNRLLITAHGKKGKTLVTIRDKKDNTVSLPVTVAYGAITLYGNSQDFLAVDADNKLLANDALQAKVKEAMRSYSFLED